MVYYTHRKRRQCGGKAAHESRGTPMATQMQTITSGRFIVRSLAAVVVGFAGVVGIGAAFLTNHPSTSAPTVPARVVMAVPLGIDLPNGALRTALPSGLTDYVRGGASAVPTTNPVLGIDTPAGADLAMLPAGYRDYIRRVSVSLATNPALGIDLPAGATRSDLPAGLSDYVHTR